jgi:hypothetical protein
MGQGEVGRTGGMGAKELIKLIGGFILAALGIANIEAIARAIRHLLGY